MCRWQHHNRVLGIFSPRMRSKGYLGTSCQKSDPAIRSGDLDFLYDKCIFTTEWRLGIYSMFLCYCVAWPCDLDPWPVDLKIVKCTVLLVSDPYRPTNFYYPTTFGYWVTSTEYLITFRYLKQSLRMRRVTWHLTGSNNSPHFWNSWPQFAYSLCHFQGATTKIKPCYRRKIAFSHFEGYKVYCTLMYETAVYPLVNGAITHQKPQI